MLKPLWLLLVLCAISFPSFAEEDFGAVPAAAGEQKELPLCSDGRLTEQVIAKILKQFEDNPQPSMVERRHRQLLLRNLKSFAEIPAAGFNRAESRSVADKLLMVKVNNGLNDGEVRLCRSASGSRLTPVYLLLYPENHQTIVDILNFLPGAAANSEFFIIYE